MTRKFLFASLAAMAAALYFAPHSAQAKSTVKAPAAASCCVPAAACCTPDAPCCE